VPPTDIPCSGDVLNILLQIMEDGILTDGKGRTVSFKNVILVMTSNVGSKRILDVSREDPFGAHATPATAMNSDERNNALYPKYLDVVTEALEAQMKPELLNRIDEIVVFSPLSENDLVNIADLIMQKTVGRAQKELKGMEILVQPNLVERVVQEGSANAAQFGARPMRRAAQRFLEDAVSDAIIQGFLKEGDVAEIDIENVDLGGQIGTLDEIIVRRRSDGKTLKVIVEDGTGGIGQASSYKNDDSFAGPNGSGQNSQEMSLEMTYEEETIPNPDPERIKKKKL